MAHLPQGPTLLQESKHGSHISKLPRATFDLTSSTIFHAPSHSEAHTGINRSVKSRPKLILLETEQISTLMSAKKDAAAIIASASRHRAPPATSYHDHPAKDVWCETQWTNLSMQAKKLELPEFPYFDPDTMLLSKEVNHKLWDQLVRE